MSKLFKVGGVSKCKSGFKVRFANDMTRVKILAKTDGNGDVEIFRAGTQPALASIWRRRALRPGALALSRPEHVSQHAGRAACPIRRDVLYVVRGRQLHRLPE